MKYLLVFILFVLFHVVAGAISSLTGVSPFAILIGITLGISCQNLVERRLEKKYEETKSL